MGLEVIEQLQGHVIGVSAVMSGCAEVEVDPAGKRADAVDAAVFPGQVEKGAVTGIVDPFGQQVQHLPFIGKQIGPAAAAAAGRAAGSIDLPTAERMLKDPAAEAVCRPVQEGDPPPAVTTGPLVPDDPPL